MLNGFEIIDYLVRLQQLGIDSLESDDIISSLTRALMPTRDTMISRTAGNLLTSNNTQPQQSLIGTQAPPRRPAVPTNDISVDYTYKKPVQNQIIDALITTPVTKRASFGLFPTNWF